MQTEHPLRAPVTSFFVPPILQRCYSLLQGACWRWKTAPSCEGGSLWGQMADAAELQLTWALPSQAMLATARTGTM